MTAETVSPCVQGVQDMHGIAIGQSTCHQMQYAKNSWGYYSSSSAIYNPEYTPMEAWLDEHPDFVNDYFLR